MQPVPLSEGIAHTQTHTPVHTGIYTVHIHLNYVLKRADLCYKKENRRKKCSFVKFLRGIQLKISDRICVHITAFASYVIYVKFLTFFSSK